MWGRSVTVVLSTDTVGSLQCQTDVFFEEPFPLLQEDGAASEKAVILNRLKPRVG